jgi:hypothetical protein
VAKHRGNNHFHEGESEDVYDLFNACNGRLHNGRLDIQQLENLGEKERELFSISRLRELWYHIDSGCDQCQAIIKTLHRARIVMKII